MLKVTCLDSGPGEVTLKFEGRIVGPWVEELKKECEICLAKHARLVIDFSNVSFMDNQGIRITNNLLKKFKEDRVRLTGCSLFLSGLLSE